MEILHANTLKAEDVRELTEQRLREHLSFEVEGYRLSTSMVLNVLLKAAIENRSIEAVCRYRSDYGTFVQSKVECPHQNFILGQGRHSNGYRSENKYLATVWGRY